MNEGLHLFSNLSVVLVDEPEQELTLIMKLMMMMMMRFIIMMVIMMIFDDSLPTCFAKRSYTLFSIWLLLPGRFLEKTIACKIFINMLRIILPLW